MKFILVLILGLTACSPVAVRHACNDYAQFEAVAQCVKDTVGTSTRDSRYLQNKVAVLLEQYKAGKITNGEAKLEYFETVEQLKSRAIGNATYLKSTK